MRRFRTPLFLTLCLLIVSTLTAQSNGTIRGTVITSDGDPIANAQIELIQLNRSTRSAADGTFSFEGVPTGRYLVQTFSPRYGSTVSEVELAAGETEQIVAELDLSVHREEIVVSASPEARQAEDAYQPVELLAHEELTLRLEPTLGETLAKSPGVSSTYFGPAASRPVIRGFGGDRIRILEEGVGVGDASNVSPDHAVSYDPINAEHIEIVRGPATLLYGSNAVGGIVNIRDERVPTVSPGVPLTGTIDLRAGTVAEELSGAISLQGAQRNLVWTVGAFRREAGDLEIPGPAERAHEGEPEEDTGVLHNSALDADGLNAGVSWIAERGYIGVSVSDHGTLYGIPVHHHPEEEEHEGAGARPFQEDGHEEDVRIDMQQRRLDVRGELRDPFPAFTAVKLRFGAADYEHTELEGGEPATIFRNDSWEGRLEAPHRALGRFRGALGFQLARRDFEAIGDEAFVPPSTSDTAAVFLFEETSVGAFDLQLGARWESNKVATDALRLPDPELPGGEGVLTSFERSFRGLSGSAGAVWRISPGYTLASSVSRAVRAPTAEELLSNGPHLATFTFELGNPALEEETSVGADLSLRKLAGRLTGEVNVFVNQFDGFIFQSPTGLEADELPVFVFAQGDARFWGFEAHGDVELIHREPNHLDLELSADWVNAELETGTNLPRIPPLRFAIGLRFRGERLWSLAEARHTFEQDEVATFETTTDGYTLLNAAVGYRFFVGNSVHEVALRGTNLSDELVRNHVSPLKDLVPLPGRDFTLSYRMTM